MAAQMVGRIADFALTGQKHQHIALPAWVAPQLVQGIGNRLVQPIFAAVFKGAVAQLHRVGAARHHDHRRWALGRGKVLGKPIGIDGGRGDDDFQIGAARQNLPQIAEQKINVQAAFMRLVDDQGVVGQQQGVGLRLGQQNAIGHQLDRGARAQAVLEANFVTHHLAQGGLQLVGNAPRDRGGRNPAGLGVANHARFLARWRVASATAQRQRHLGQLGGFARTGFAANDHHRVLGDGGHDVFAPQGDGQFGGEFNLQWARPSRERFWVTIVNYPLSKRSHTPCRPFLTSPLCPGFDR